MNVMCLSTHPRHKGDTPKGALNYLVSDKDWPAGVCSVSAMQLGAGRYKQPSAAQQYADNSRHAEERSVSVTQPVAGGRSDAT